MKLNLGAGDQYVPNWHNVDIPECPHRADEYVNLAGPLPWPAKSLTAVYAGHVLEHLTLPDAHKLLSRLHPLMAPGAQLAVVGPDVPTARRMFIEGEQLEVPIEHIDRGSQRWPGDEHKWTSSLARTEKLLITAGWEIQMSGMIDQLDQGWPVAFRGPKWQFAIVATTRNTEEQNASADSVGLG